MTRDFLKNLLIFFIALGSLAIGFWYVRGEGDASGVTANANMNAGLSAGTDSPLPTDSVADKSKKTGLLFGGDVMLDRHVRSLISKNSVEWLLGDTKKLFSNIDGSVFNLEGPITSNPSVSQYEPVSAPAHFKFTFDPKSSTDFFQVTRAVAVSLGNNHAMNFGSGGVDQTKQFLTQDQVGFFGAPNDQGESSVWRTTMNGQTFSFVAYNWFGGPSLEETLATIRTEKLKSDFIIVMPHWGVEYALESTDRQQKEAHACIDAGADAVIGSHSHVVQNVEVYNGKTIFYSLGNFIFDQNFSSDVRERLLVTVMFEGDEISFAPHPIYLENAGQLRLMDEEVRKRLFERIF